MTIKQLISPIFSTCLAASGAVVLYFARAKLIKHLDKKNKNPTPLSFVINFVYGALLFVLIIPVLAEYGVPTASLLTLLGTSSLAIGLALKGFLSNIAAGIMVILQRQFVVGDLVESQGTLGTVEKIDLFSICLRTPANELVYIQNNKLISDKIVNKNTKQRRRVEFSIEVSYDTDLTHAKSIITKCIDDDERVLKDPKPTIVTDKMNDYSIGILVRFWVIGQDMLRVKQDMLETIKSSLEQQNIEFPFPQLEVTMKSH